MLHWPFSSQDDLKNFFQIIHFGRVVVQCEPDDYQFSKTSIPPSVRTSIHPLPQIILVLNLQFSIESNQFNSSTSSDDLCLLFCQILLLCFLPFPNQCCRDGAGPKGRLLIHLFYTKKENLTIQLIFKFCIKILYFNMF